MRYWRMAMREGSLGTDWFPACCAKGIAAIDYWGEDGRRIVGDCRRLTTEQFKLTWQRKWPRGTSPRASLRHLRWHMKKGDVIYAKTGMCVVGKGRIVGGYTYDPTILRDVQGARAWAHYVRVRWEEDFVPFGFRFDAQQATILELAGERLKRVQRAERAARRHAASVKARRVQVPQDALPDDLAAVEGRELRMMVAHRQRERRLRQAKIRQVMGLTGGKLRCEVPGCGFDFSERYGELGREFAFVHHKDGLAARGKPAYTRLDDLAIVCGNCHAMIHRGGQCRELAGLIAHGGEGP